MNEINKNRKRFRKIKAWHLIVFTTIILTIIPILSLGAWKLFLRWYDSGTYTECNPVKMVNYLEKRYKIEFPENM